MRETVGLRDGRLPDGDYRWTSPTGHTYTASPTPEALTPSTP
jgi:hypothetical protein